MLKCGVERVWFDPDRLEDVASAITRQDIRMLIDQKVIVKKQKQGISRARANVLMRKKRKGLRRGPGKRKGTASARLSSKQRWMTKIRAQRRLLKKLRTSGKINKKTYRKFYKLAKGNSFRDKGHLMANIQQTKERGGDAE